MRSPAQQVDDALAKAETHYSDYEGGQLFWQRWPAIDTPTAVPLLLLHGGFGAWNHWIRNVDTLRQQRDVWTLDLPGLGRSGDMPEPHTIAHFAHIVLGGFNQLAGRDQPFALAGFSFGAMIAGELAVLAGARCQRCTLIGAVGISDVHVQVDLLPLPTAESTPEQAEAIHRENLQRLMLHKPDAIDDLAVHLHGDNLARHHFRSRRLAATNQLAECLPHIPAKLVGIWGVEDATAGGHQAVEARRLLFQQAQPGSEFHAVPDAGHWVMYEAPDRVNQVLLGDL